MKTIALLFILTLLASCGSSSSGGGGENASGKNPIQARELGPEESALKTALIEGRVFTQEKLMQTLLSYRHLNEGTLAKLDPYLIINCSEGSGLCYVDQRL